MELIKKNIHMNRMKGKAVTQLTLDDDVNVPDTKPDIEKIITDTGEIRIDEIKTGEEFVVVKGTLEVQILYMSDMEDKSVHNMKGSLPFEERINLEGAENGDAIQLKWELEDLSVNLINSRKISMQTIVTLNVFIEELYDEETAVELHDNDNAMSRCTGLDTLQMVMNKKDVYRIKEEIALGSNKPNIYEIVWSSVQIRNQEVRIMDNKLAIKGELLLFLLYTAEGEVQTPQWMEHSLPFQGEIECQGCNESMISNIEVVMSHKDIEGKPDYDGEERLISIEVALELNIKLYEEEHIEVLQDVYSEKKMLTPQKEKAFYDSLLVKNFSKCRTSDRIKIQENQARVLQICHSMGEVKIDTVEIVENGIEVEGAIEIHILYITADDKIPFYSMKNSVPFHHIIEAKGIDEKCIYDLKGDLEQISTTMIDSEEIEVKATVNLNTIVFRKEEKEIIVQINEAPLDLKQLQELPGIVGYIVKGGDNLWDIAKKYFTSIEKIMESNELNSEDIRPGDRLIIMKSVE